MRTNHPQLNRRTFVLAAAGTAAVGLAGCLGDDGSDDSSDGDDGDDGSNDDNSDDEAWEDVSEIELEGVTQNWIGVAPEPIEDEENPTLVLYEGREYDVTWENGDGVDHNIEFRDDSGSVIEGTERMGDEGETQTLTFEATSDMVTYVCNPHATMMVGDVEVRSE